MCKHAYPPQFSTVYAFPGAVSWEQTLSRRATSTGEGYDKDRHRTMPRCRAQQEHSKSLQGSRRTVKKRKIDIAQWLIDGRAGRDGEWPAAAQPAEWVFTPAT